MYAADYLVTDAAASAGLLKNWNFSDITWTAILSNSTSNAIDRVPILGPVYNTRDELVATDAADMWDGTIAHAIQYDEFGSGGISSNFSVWTGTTSHGIWTNASAGDNWNNPALTANIGNLTRTSLQWTNSAALPASQVARLYGVGPQFTVPQYGDYNEDGVVNGADYTVWQQLFGRSDYLASPADWNRDGVVDAADYTVWRDHLAGGAGAGSAGASPSHAVPEPMSVVLVLLGGVALALRGLMVFRPQRGPSQ